MLRMSPVASAKRAEEYYGKSDGGYYVGDTDLRRKWGGIGAELLGLKGPPEFEQLKRLIHGLDPHTGEQLTAKLIDKPSVRLGRHRLRAQGRDVRPGAGRRPDSGRDLGRGRGSDGDA